MTGLKNIVSDGMPVLVHVVFCVSLISSDKIVSSNVPILVTHKYHQHYCCTTIHSPELSTTSFSYHFTFAQFFLILCVCVYVCVRVCACVHACAFLLSATKTTGTKERNETGLPATIHFIMFLSLFSTNRGRTQGQSARSFVTE